MTTPNNSILWNTTVAGMVAGFTKGRRLLKSNSSAPPLIGTPDPAYATIASQALNLAQEVNTGTAPTGIVNDNASTPFPTGTQAISVVSTGVAISPTTGAITLGQIEKDLCLKALVLGLIEGRSIGFGPQANGTNAVLTPAECAGMATTIEGAYAVFATVFIQPQTFPTSVNNQLLLFAAYCGALSGMLANNPGLATEATSAEIVEVIGLACSGLGFAVDALVANDALISNAAGTGNGGSALAGGGVGGTYQNQVGKTLLMFSIASAAMYNRNVGSLTSQFLNTLTGGAAIASWVSQVAPAIAAAYNSLVSGILTGAAAVNNPTLLNAAYAGFVAGNLSSRPFTTTSGMGAASPSNPTYNNQNFTAIAAAASAFASAVDTAVNGVDATGTPIPAGSVFITVTGEGGFNEGVVPSNGTLVEGQLAKTNLMWAICRGVIFGRPLVGGENPEDETADTNTATYTLIASHIVALYLEVANVSLNTP
jgi:hypothetical protein